MTAPGSIHIVLPVRGMAHDAEICVASLSVQLGPHDRITVVDDGSRDDISVVARFRRVELVRLTGGRGPYAARHAIASASTCDHLLFVDARCRARPGLLNAHRGLLDQDGIALSCTGTLTLPGSTFAGRVAAHQQPFALRGKIGNPGRLDFFPTANLGVRAAAYRTVGGFRDMRSGADADLCWRVQQAGLGRMGADPSVLMEWEPRRSWRDLQEQWTRYGESTAYLEQVFGSESPAGAVAAGSRSRVVKALVARAAGTPIRELPALGGSVLVHRRYQQAYRRARLVPAPTPTLYGALPLTKAPTETAPAEAVGT